MKKYIVIALAAVVAFTACTKTNPEEKESEKISFSVANYAPATKAQVSILPETTQFKSKAYLHANGVTGAQDYFGANGETIKWFENDAEWRPELNYYWPKSANSYINFVSWYAKNQTNVTVTETTIIWPSNGALTADENFMWADEAWGFRNNDGAIYKKDGVTEGVPTLFHHALAKLTIKAKATTVEKNGTRWDITLENFNLYNYVTNATLTLTNTKTQADATPSTAGYTAVWERNNGAGLFISSETGSLTTDADDVVLLNGRSIYPMLQADAAFNFNVRIKAYHGETLYSQELVPVNVLVNTLGSPAITTWEMNTKYTYTIIINPETKIIKFDPAMTAWESASEATYTWSAE